MRFSEAYELYVSGTTMKARGREHYRQIWPQIEPTLGHLFIEQVDTSAMDALKRALGLRELNHHALGRHSVASQAVTHGHSIKAVQAQLGHRSEQSTHMYAHLGSGAQRRLVEALAPLAPPHVNHASTSKKKGT